MQSPHDSHCQMVKLILRHLQGNISHGLFWVPPKQLDLVDFSEVDWASNPDDRHPITCYYFFFGSNLITWCVKKQPTFSRSSIKAEYPSLRVATLEGI